MAKGNTLGSESQKVNYPPDTFNLIERPFRPSSSFTQVENLTEIVEELYGKGRYRTALDEVFKVLDKDPANEHAFRLAIILVGTRRTQRVQAEEPLTDAYLLDRRLDPIFTVCSHCQSSTWVSPTADSTDPHARSFTWNPIGKQCQNCGYVVCRDCMRVDKHLGEGYATLADHCPNCGQNALGVTVFATGRLPQQMARHPRPVGQVFIFREGPVPPDEKYMKGLLEIYSPDALEDDADLIGIPMFPWPDNIVEAAVNKLVELQIRDQILKGKLEEAEEAYPKDDEGNRVYVIKLMRPSPDSLQESLAGPPDIEKLKVEGSLGELIKALNYRSDSSVRENAAEALGELGDPQALEPLITALEDEERSVCDAAFRALNKMGWENCIKFCAPPVDQLITFLNTEREGILQVSEREGDILLALGQIVALIEDSQPRIRAIELLIASLKHGLYRSAAAEALGHATTQMTEGSLRSRIVASLKDALDDVDKGVRKAAAAALEKIGVQVKEADELELLRQQLLSNDYYVREAARKQAQSLTDRAKYSALEQAYQASQKLQQAIDQQGWGDTPISLCREIIQLEPDFSAAYAVLSYLYRWYPKKYDLALEWAQKAVKIAPKNEDAWNELGLVYVELGDVVAATQAFLTVIDLDPEVSNVEPYLRLIDVFTKLGMRHEAVHARERIARAGVGLESSQAERWSCMVMRADIGKLREVTMASLKNES
jgi:tetratricopeptide (TPR) repeat protein